MPIHDIEIIDHTADIGIRLSRPTLADLFRDAAFGMFSISAPESKFDAAVEKNIDVQGGDYEELLVNWLSELNFYFQTEQFAPADFNLKFKNNNLQATVLGEIVDLKKHNIEIEIKAVTYHKISIVNKNGLWHAQVIFDV